MTNATPKKRRIFRTVAIGGAALLGILFAASWSLLQLDAGRRYIVDTALRSINEDEGTQISYDALSGHWPWRIGIANIQIADKEGVWATAKSVSIDWSPLSLMRSRLTLQTVSVTDTIVSRLPVSDAPPETNDALLPGIPDLPIGIVVDRLSISNLELMAPIIGTQIAADADAKLRWTNNLIDVGLELTQRENAGTTVTASLQLRQIAKTLKLAVDLEEGGVGIIHHLVDLPSSERLTVQLTGDGSSIDWRGKLNLDAGGLGTSTSTLHLVAVSPVDASMEINLVPGTSIAQKWRDAIGPDATLTAKLISVTSQFLQIERSALTTKSGLQGSAKGSVDFKQNRISAKTTLSVNDTAVLSGLANQTLAGSLDVAADVSGVLTDPTVMSTITGDELVVDTTTFGTLVGQVNWPGMGTKNGQIDIAIESAIGPGTVTSSIIRQGTGLLSFPDLNADWLTTKVTGALTSDQGGGVWGDVVFEIASLSQLSFITQFVGAPDIAGAANGSVSIPQPSTGGLTQFDISLAGFKYGRGANALKLEEMTAVGRIDPSDVGTLDVSVNGARLTAPGVVGPILIQSFSGMAEGSTRKSIWSLNLLDINQKEETLAIAGRFSETADGQVVSFEKVSGTLNGQNTSLAATTTLRRQMNSWELTPFSISYGDGAIEGEAAATGTAIKARANLSRVPMTFESGDLEGLEGQLDGTLRLDTSAARKLGTADLRLSTRADRMDTAISTNLMANWDGRRISVDGDIKNAGSFNGSLPLTHNSETGDFSIPGAQKINFKASIGGPVGPLWRLTPFSEYEIRGQGSLEVSAIGTWDQPVITGVARLSEGYFESQAEGIFLNDLSLNAEAKNSEVATLRITATDGQKGRIKGEGKIIFDAAQDVPVVLNLDFDKAQIVRNEIADAQISGRVGVTGNRNALNLKGDIVIGRMDVRVPKELPPQVVDLTVEEVNVPPALKRNDVKSDQTSQLPLSLDVNISAPNRLFIAGRGLESEWKANVGIKGKVTEPRLRGKVEVVKGTFDFAGRTFDITKGNVIFDGGKEIDPRLDIVATRDDDDVSLGVAVRGPSSDPKITLQSTPSMPQEDVLALILFGKPIAELTYIELAQLAESLASLSGKGLGGGGRGVFGNVRQSLGIDVLSLDTGSITDASTDEEVVGPSLTVGKYVTDRVYVGVTQGSDEDSTAVEVEVDITRRLSLSTEVGQKANSNIGLNWSWDY